MAPRSVRMRRGVADGAQLRAALDELGIADGQDFLIAVPDDADVSADGDALGPFGASDTSRYAALANYPRSGAQRRRVLDAIIAARAVGQIGLTRDELSHALNLADSSVDARVWELLRGGFVEVSGVRRRTRTNQLADVVRPTIKALDGPEAGVAKPGGDPGDSPGGDEPAGDGRIADKCGSPAGSEPEQLGLTDVPVASTPSYLDPDQR